MARFYRKRFGDAGFWTFPPASPKRLKAVQGQRLWETLWEDCKAAAIERAAGL